MMSEQNNLMMWGGGFMWIFWLMILILIVIFIKYLLNERGESTQERKETAMEVLEKRLASGEIDTVEFERLKRELERSTSS